MINYINRKNSKVKTKTVHNQNGSEEVVKTPAIARAYIIHAILRLLVEAGFIYLQVNQSFTNIYLLVSKFKLVSKYL